jgi:hypothetical protein
MGAERHCSHSNSPRIELWKVREVSQRAFSSVISLLPASSRARGNRRYFTQERHDAHPTSRLATNQWLLTLQRSPQAWAVTTSLFAAPDPPPPTDLLFFSTQMLHRKIQSDTAVLAPGAG